MAKQRDDADTIGEKLDALIRLTQDQLILHALQAGVNSHKVAAMVRIDKRRVSHISKYLNEAKK